MLSLSSLFFIFPSHSFLSPSSIFLSHFLFLLSFPPSSFIFSSPSFTLFISFSFFVFHCPPLSFYLRPHYLPLTSPRLSLSLSRHVDCVRGTPLPTGVGYLTVLLSTCPSACQLVRPSLRLFMSWGEEATAKKVDLELKVRSRISFLLSSSASLRPAWLRLFHSLGGRRVGSAAKRSRKV